MNRAQQILILSARLYQGAVSPLLRSLAGPTAGCRFTPSCSEYAISAVSGHGAIKGSLLAAARLCRCHPFGGCGYDPVPPASARSTAQNGSRPPTADFLNSPAAAQ